MKRLLKWFCAALIALVAIVATTSCNDHSGRRQKHSIKEYVDSADLYKILSEMSNPTFKSLDDVNSYYRKAKESRVLDSTFFSLPLETITNVYSVLVRNNVTPSKDNIAKEYLDNIRVYSNLPKSEDVYESLNNGAPDIPNDIPNTVTVDTIINGKHVKILQESSTQVK